jgi:multidrug efflux system membrane fusion protein
MRHLPTTQVIVPALAGILLLAGCSSKIEEAPAVRPVLVEHPQAMLGESGEVFPGTVHAREEADLSFRVPGRILLRHANAGDPVRAGEMLATLDAQDAQLNVQAAQASVSAAAADVTLADAELQRYKELLAKGYISKSAIDLKQNTRDLTQARLDQAKANRAVILNQSNYTILAAPKAGLITAVTAEAGQVVAAGQPVFRFAAGDEREVLIHVPEGRVDILRKARKLSVSLWAQPGKLYPAKLREINLQADRSTRTHEARVTILQPGSGIDLGTTAAVILGERVDQTLFIVPLSSIGGTKEQPGVWVIEAGKSRLVPVQPVRYLETGVVVKADLKPEMSIVSAGAQLVVPGQEVRTIERKRDGAPS